MRKITIITSGTRGDVQPFVALALALQRAGYAVRLATHASFRAWVVGQGIEHAPLAGDPQELLASEAGRAFLNPSGPLGMLRGFFQFIRVLDGMILQQARDGLAAAAGSDFLLYSFSAPLAALVAEKLQLPSACAALAPMARTRAFSNIFLGGRDLGPVLNGASHRLFEALVGLILRGKVAKIRREHAMGRDRFNNLFARHYAGRVPMITAVSPKVQPIPADWPAWHPFTGYWIIDGDGRYAPPADLAAFLAAGPPPLYVGFGSMVDKDPAALTALVVEAAAAAGQRILISKGWSRLGSVNLGANVFALGDVPHEWLFPRLAGVVHHGGAGTTAAALRAGVPSLVVPFGVDQPYWGRRVAALGAGCAPIPRRKLTADALAAAFARMANDAAMRRTAAALGRELRAENGAQAAVRVIEAQLAGVAARAAS